MRLKMFCAVVLLLLNIFDSAVFAQSFNQSNLKLKETSCLTADSQIVLTEKNPFLAGTFSFAVPGFALGQIYNKQYSKFFVHAIISSACILTVFLSIDRGTEPFSQGSGTQTRCTLSTISIAAMYVYAGNWIWSIVDAVISANKINSQVRLRKNRSDIFDKMNFGLTVNKNK